MAQLLFQVLMPHTRVVKNGKFSSESVTGGSDLTAALLLRSALVIVNTGSPKQCLGARRSLRSRENPRLPLQWAKGSQPRCSQPGTGCSRCVCACLVFSVLTDTAGWAALSTGLCSTAIRHPEQQERRHPLIHKIHQLADTDP